MNSLALIFGIQCPVHALAQLLRAKTIHFTLRWRRSINGHVIKMLRQQIEPLKARFNIGIASFSAHKVVNGPNARADLPRIENANRESGCEGDNRG